MESQLGPRTLHVRVVNDRDYPLLLWFRDGYTWRLILKDLETGETHTFYQKDPVRHLYWSIYLDPGQFYGTTFKELPPGRYQARIDLLAQWRDPLFLSAVEL
ncbi:MAG: hypothetical protein QJR00_06725 [Bacillota bacterium]|nr:hypothetical protein [Bacillota bacterium]